MAASPHARAEPPAGTIVTQAAATFRSADDSREMRPGAPGAVINIYPWGPMTKGKGVTMLSLDAGPKRMQFAISSVEKNPGHCFGKNVHRVSIVPKPGEPVGAIRPVGKRPDGDDRWPMALFISPAAPKAALMPLAPLRSLRLPDEHIHANLTAAVDITGDGKPDALIITTCIQYEKNATRLNRTDHRQCAALKGQNFDQVYLLRGGKWVEIEYEDLC